MRVLLTTWGSRGDVEPVAGLASRLLELGAEVRVAAPPDEEFVELLARAGVPLVPLGPKKHRSACVFKGRGELRDQPRRTRRKQRASNACADAPAPRTTPTKPVPPVHTSAAPPR
ncbi:glycosyltransferase [Streptomyces prunicolor]|uniref:glycosyltransferase n=1 Tax=Streptomyces prunicolor TaxID=67348 RepID=UPI003F4D397B